MDEHVTLLGDLILIERVNPKEISDGGILLSPSASMVLQEGVVVAVGLGKIMRPGNWRKPMEVIVGDKVLFSKHVNLNVELFGKEFVVCHEPDVICIINGDL